MNDQELTQLAITAQTNQQVRSDLWSYTLEHILKPLAARNLTAFLSNFIDADDLAQEVLIRIQSNFALFQSDLGWKRFCMWCFRQQVYQLNKFHSRQKRQGGINTVSLDELPDAHQLIASTCQPDMRQTTMHMDILSILDPRQRIVYESYMLNQEPAADVAQRLGCAPKTVANIASAIRARVKQYLES